MDAALSAAAQAGRDIKWDGPTRPAKVPAHSTLRTCAAQSPPVRFPQNRLAGLRLRLERPSPKAATGHRPYDAHVGHPDAVPALCAWARIGDLDTRTIGPPQYHGRRRAAFKPARRDARRTDSW